jgi:hypothetical protein
VAAAAVLAYAAPAQATPYRFWSYWKWTGSSWAFQNVGPSGHLDDGTVIGWRFAIQQDSASASAPRADGGFADICTGGTGVGVVIDYGVTSDAPSGETPPRSRPRGFCATGDDDDNGYRATAAHASLRVNGSGLVCGIDGYPKTECGATVHPSPTPNPTHTHTSSGGKGGGTGGGGGGQSGTRSSGSSGSSSTTQRPDDASPADGTAKHQQPAKGPASPAATRAGTSDATPGQSPSPTPSLDLDASAPETDEGGGSSTGLVIGVVAAAVIAGAAVWQYRARS